MWCIWLLLAVFLAVGLEGLDGVYYDFTSATIFGLTGSQVISNMPLDYGTCGRDTTAVVGIVSLTNSSAFPPYGGATFASSGNRLRYNQLGVTATIGISMMGWIQPLSVGSSSTPRVVVSMEAQGVDQLQGQSYSIENSTMVLYLVNSTAACSASVFATTSYEMLSLQAASPSGVVKSLTPVHLACVFDGSELQLYVNGSKVASTPFSGVLNASPTSRLLLGGDGFNTSVDTSYQGLLGQVRLVMEPLSASLVQVLASVTQAPPAPTVKLSGNGTYSSEIYATLVVQPNITYSGNTTSSKVLQRSSYLLYSYDTEEGCPLRMQVTDNATLSVVFYEAVEFYGYLQLTDFFRCYLTDLTVSVSGYAPRIASNATLVPLPVTQGQPLVIQAGLDAYPAPTYSYYELLSNGTLVSLASLVTSSELIVAAVANASDANRTFAVSAYNAYGDFNRTLPGPNVVAAGGATSTTSSPFGELTTTSAPPVSSSSSAVVSGDTLIGIIVGSSVVGALLIGCALICSGLACCVVLLLALVALMVVVVVALVALVALGAIGLGTAGGFATLSALGVRRLVLRVRGAGIAFSELVDSEVVLGERLGMGLRGPLHRAKWHSVDVVAEVLRAPQSEWHRLALQQEATFCERFGGHAHVVKYVGAVTQSQERALLVREWMRFGSVHDVLMKKRHASLELALRSRLCRDVLAGLAALHAEELVYGCLSVASVLVSTDFRALLAFPRLQPWVLWEEEDEEDEGLDGEGEEATTSTSRTKEDLLKHLDPGLRSMLLKHLRTVAPEVLAGDPLSQAADVYAFGVFVLETLTGKRVFKKLSPAEVVHAVVVDGKLPRIPASVDPMWASLLVDCLSPNPDLRPSVQSLRLLLLDTSEPTDPVLDSQSSSDLKSFLHPESSSRESFASEYHVAPRQDMNPADG